MKFTTNPSSLGRIFLGAATLSLLSLVKADFATCVSGWEWSYNSEGLNPCEIAGSLQAPCLGYSVYTLGPLANGSNYVTPQKNDTSAKDCGCNTIIYSLYQACTLCQTSQNLTALTWAFWSQYCDSVYVAQYPKPIPYNASVPHWTYLNDTNPGFDPVLAQAAGRDPEATPTTPPTVAISSSHTLPGTNPGQSTLGTNTSPNPSSTTTNGGGGSKSNTGAIAGGVVGGVVGVTALAALAFFFFRRRTPQSNPNTFVGVDQMAYNPAAVDHQGYDAPKLYNPADPTTFPSPVSGGDSGSGGYTTNTTSQYQGGRYHGAAEL